MHQLPYKGDRRTPSVCSRFGSKLPHPRRLARIPMTHRNARYDALAKGDVILALLRYLWLAELGYELAQYNAAYIIQTYQAEVEAAGVFVGAKPSEVALLLMQRSADQEHVDSIVQVADVLFDGEHAEEDHTEAFRLYRVAGMAGSARALFNIGWAHQSGDGLPLDLAIAKRYYDMALATESEAWAPVSIAKSALKMQTAVFEWTGLDLLQAVRAVFAQEEGDVAASAAISTTAA